MKQYEKMTAWHKAQIGTSETPPGTNNVRYNTAYYGREVSDPTGDSFQWCMSYHWCGFQETGLGDLFMDGGRTASCTGLYKWAVSHGRWVTGGFREGDILIYSSNGSAEKIYHTGYYTGDRTSNGRLIAIEGNVNNAVQYVYRRLSEVFGAFRPAWADEDAEPDPETVTVELPVLRMGETGIPVLMLQSCLQAAGFRLPKYGADGEWGSETQSAVLGFQTHAKITVDGIVDAETWTKLLRG